MCDLSLVTQYYQISYSTDISLENNDLRYSTAISSSLFTQDVAGATTASRGRWSRAAAGSGTPGTDKKTFWSFKQLELHKAEPNVQLVVINFITFKVGEKNGNFRTEDIVSVSFQETTCAINISLPKKKWDRLVWSPGVAPQLAECVPPWCRAQQPPGQWIRFLKFNYIVFCIFWQLKDLNFKVL